MIHVDETDPIGEIEQSFPSRDVTIKRGIDAKEIYELLSEIGRGKFGTVYKCQEKSTGLQLAAKFVPIPKREDRRNGEREVEIMNSLQHSLIIQLYDALVYDKMMCVVLELIEGGELFDRVIDDDFVLTERACIIFVRQVCQAMEFIHRSNILHLDLKPENILCLTRNGNRIKIIDFGLARKYDPDKKLQVLFGTPEFVAPEVVNFDRICFGTDMWSVGVICYVLLSGLSPFMGATDIETMANVTVGKYDFDDEAFNTVSKDALNFISKLLVKESSSRLTASECLEHIWLKRRPPPQQPQQQQQQQTLQTKLQNSLVPLSMPATIVQPSTPQTPSTPSTPSSLATPPTPPVLPSASPPLLLESSPPASVTTTLENGDKELRTTKDNLKSFIERWEEHPNSPYVFDIGSGRISPISVVPDFKRNGSSGLSSRGCSPSPCGSISSEVTPIDDALDDVFVEPNTIAANNNRNINNHTIALNEPTSDENGHHKNLFKEYLQSFERRNSDSNYVLNQSSSCEKINLAAEIQKLSERLLMLSSINVNLSEYNDKVISDTTTTTTPTTPTTPKIPTTTTTEATAPNTCKPPPEEKEPKPIVRKSDATQKVDVSKATSKKSKATINSTNGSNNGQDLSNDSMRPVKKNLFNRSNSTASTATTTTTSGSTGKQKPKENGLSERLKLLDDTPQLSRKFHKSESIENCTNRLKTTSISSSSSTILTSTSSSSSSSSSTYQATSNGIGLGVGVGVVGGAPWPITTKRTKFRITQMSRDVPMNSPHSHQPVFLEEAVTTTKDCLLHLLEKYNDVDQRTHSIGTTIGRHQSISDGFGISDNLECRSMNSLNFFFQRHAGAGTTVKQIQQRIESKRVTK